MLMRIGLSVPVHYYGGWLQGQTRDGLQARSTRCLPASPSLQTTRWMAQHRHSLKLHKNNRGPAGDSQQMPAVALGSTPSQQILQPGAEIYQSGLAGHGMV